MEWYEKDGYNALKQHGVIVEDPNCVIKFKGQCYGTDSWNSQEVVDALPWQAGCTVSESDQWEYDNAHETVDIYDRTVDYHCWSRPLGLWLDSMSAGPMDNAYWIAEYGLVVKTLYGDEGVIVGVHSDSSDDLVKFFVLQYGEYVTKLDRELIANPADLKEMKGE